MKYIGVIVIFILFACSPSSTKKEKPKVVYLEELAPFLLADTNMEKNYVFTQNNIKVEVKNNSQNSYICLKTTHPELIFNHLQTFYNTQFSKTDTNTVFNVWNNNEQEYMLYKQSDSTIFVNIYRKTYK